MSSIGPQLPPSLSKRKRSVSPSSSQSSYLDDQTNHSTAENRTYSKKRYSSMNEPMPDAKPQHDGNCNSITIAENNTTISQVLIKSPDIQSQTFEISDDSLGNTSSSDSDSDDYGPAIAGSSVAIERRSLVSQADIPKRNTKKTQYNDVKRDEWMLAPPSELNSSLHDIPSKSRGFATGSSWVAHTGKQPLGNQNVVGNSWTETLDEKRRRLENAILGNELPTKASAKLAKSASATESSTISSKVSQEIHINTYIAQTRGKSLLEETQKAMNNDNTSKEEDPSKRAFDRQKDMAVGGRLGVVDKQKFINSSAGFGGRFSGGSYL